MAIPDKVEIGSELTEFPGGSFNAIVNAFFPNTLKDGRPPTRTINTYAPHAELLQIVIPFDTEAEEPSTVKHTASAPAWFNAYVPGWFDLPAADRPYDGVWNDVNPLNRSDPNTLIDIDFVGSDSGVWAFNYNAIGTAVGPYSPGQTVSVIRKGLAWMWVRIHEAFHDRVDYYYHYTDEPTWIAGLSGWPIVWRKPFTEEADYWCLVDVRGDYGEAEHSVWHYQYNWDRVISQVGYSVHQFAHYDSAASWGNVYPQVETGYYWNDWYWHNFQASQFITHPLFITEDEPYTYPYFVSTKVARNGLVLVGEWEDAENPFPSVGAIVGPGGSIGTESWWDSFSVAGTGYHYLGDFTDTVEHLWLSDETAQLGKFIRTPTISITAGDCGAIKGTYDSANDTLDPVTTIAGLGSSDPDLAGKIIFEPSMDLDDGDTVYLVRDYRRNVADPEGEDGNEYWSTAHYGNWTELLLDLPYAASLPIHINSGGIWGHISTNLAEVYTIGTIDDEFASETFKYLLYIDNFEEEVEDGHDHSQWRDGPLGDKGVQGEEGDEGPAGATGEAGDRGTSGDQGDRGTDGEEGAVGEAGIAGEAGDEGSKGAAGPQGDQGQPGTDGEDLIYTEEDFSNITQFVKNITELDLAIVAPDTITVQLTFNLTSGGILQSEDDGAQPITEPAPGTDCAV